MSYGVVSSAFQRALKGFACRQKVKKLYLKHQLQLGKTQEHKAARAKMEWPGMFNSLSSLMCDGHRHVGMVLEREDSQLVSSVTLPLAIKGSSTSSVLCDQRKGDGTPRAECFLDT